MKKFTLLLFLAIGFTSCSVESLDSTSELLTADAKIKIESNYVTFPSMVCVGVATELCLNAAAGTNLQVQQLIEGEWVQVFQVAQSIDDPECFSLEFSTPRVEQLRYKMGPGGFSDPVDIEVVNCNECTNELVADLSCGDLNVLNLTFTAEEAGPIVIQGGLTHGTTIINKESNVLTENTGHPSVINSNSNVTRWQGDVAACEEVTITIEFTGGNGVGDWSAKRKVGDDEVTLGSTEEASCNEE